MKILLTGATGFIGLELLRILPDQKKQIIPVRFSRDNISEKSYRLDLTDFHRTNQYIRSVSPEVILHLAGHNLFSSEADKVFSHKLNYEASENLVSLCAENSIRLIFMSSDYVFEGVQGRYDESSSPRPTTQYGKDKLAVENLMREKLEDYAIIRTAAVFGKKHDFVEAVYKKLREQENFPAFVDLVNSPTYIEDLAFMLRIIIEEQLRGTFHCAGSEILSRYSFALKIADYFNYEASRIIRTERDLSKDLRPVDLSLNCAQTYTTLNYHPQSVSEILRLSRPRDYLGC